VSEIIDRILDRPSGQKIGVLIALILVIVALYYTFLHAPQSDRVSSLSEEVENARATLAQRRALAANLPKYRKQKQHLEGLLKEAVSHLPDRKEIPEILSSISSKARGADLEILLFRPQPENPREFYAEIPVDIIVQGGFHNLVAFFDGVGKLNRLVNIRNIVITNPKPQNGQIPVRSSARAVTFRFLDEKERARLAAAKKAKEKNKRR
jgi:type IV pilus assembly protein PilO